MKKKLVFLGMSGGVDSSLSLAILLKQGYDVVGVFIRTWHPDFIECNQEEERLDAMRVASFFNIPFITFDFETIYKKEVADYMISEYRLGRTPNPDVMCNKEVKFGAFLKKAKEMGADYVATGHYAQNIFNKKSNQYELCKSPDQSKDQSYFLWTLKQEQLKNILFPIGNLHKKQVRKIAEKISLPVANKKDSQGICFLGAIDLKDFLKHYIKTKKGKVLDINKKEIGTHDGAVFFTLGERRGFEITQKSPNDKPYYVIDKDIKKNILIVSNNYKEEKKDGSYCFKLINLNWTGTKPIENFLYTAQIRYHGELLFCKIIKFNRKYIEIQFQKNILIAKGQSVVFYNKNICIGGGVVA